MKLDEKTLEYFREQGRKGGMKTKELYGLNHYKRISPGRNTKLSPTKKTRGVDPV